MLLSEPHWERGYRCHGYWNAGKRLGAVSLPPHGWPLQYFWSLDRQIDGEIVDGYGRNLKTAKRCLELAHAGLVAEARALSGKD